MSIDDYPHLLGEYKKLWNNRQLKSAKTAEDTLIEAITKELKDESSHPRARKPPFVKYFYATKRILESSLTDEIKIKLLKLHATSFEKIEQNEDSP